MCNHVPYNGTMTIADPTHSRARGAQRAQGAQTLLNGLSVVRAVADGAHDLNAVTRRTGFARSSAHRLISALRSAGYLRDSPEGLSLGATLIELGSRALAEKPLAAVAGPVLERLSSQVMDTVHLAEEDDERVLYLAKIPGRRGAEMRSRVGYRMPLTRTGIGKALLLDSAPRWERLWGSDQRAAGQGAPGPYERFRSLMEGYRAGGHAFDLEENEPGIRCVAAPVRGVDGRIIGAISVSATVPYMPPERMSELVPTVTGAAREISAEMGWRGR